jgi:hypothetical protein
MNGPSWLDDISENPFGRPLGRGEVSPYLVPVARSPLRQRIPYIAIALQSRDGGAATELRNGIVTGASQKADAAGADRK